VNLTRTSIPRTYSHRKVHTFIVRNNKKLGVKIKV